jgi:hypothetical protein
MPIYIKMTNPKGFGYLRLLQPATPTWSLKIRRKLRKFEKNSYLRNYWSYWPANRLKISGIPIFLFKFNSNYMPRSNTFDAIAEKLIVQLFTWKIEDAGSWIWIVNWCSKLVAHEACNIIICIPLNNREILIQTLERTKSAWNPAVTSTTIQ